MKNQLSKGVTLTTELIDSILVIAFTRPEIRNPLSIDVVRDLYELAKVAANDAGIKAVIITGTDDVFASGADLREIAQVAPVTARQFAEHGQRLMKRIANLGKPTISAINGYCFGGALDLALSCDHRIASPTARFAHPGAGLGIITGWGGTQRLPRLVGTAKAVEMFFTAAPITAHEALGIGLVDEIADDVTARSMELALSLV